MYPKEADPNGKNAAKKAEKAAKKKEAKAQNVNAPSPQVALPSIPVAVTQSKKSVILPSKSKLQPFQLAINPNSSLNERPIVALSVAVLTNTIVDYEIISDHTRPSYAALGLPNGEVSGDTAIARYIARRASSDIIGSNDEELASIEQWIDYSNALSKFSLLRRVKAVSATLDRHLAEKTYIVGSNLTIADIALFASIGFPTQFEDAAHVESMLTTNAPTRRWMHMMRGLTPLKTATQLALGIANGVEAVFDRNSIMDELVPGMSQLEGGTIGNVVTRFPPEPSGYLHIGHAKAVLMNEYYARRYKGRLILRFDDTNPSKEKAEFENSILEDLGMLGVKPDVITYTSDYFETIRGYAEYMIENGLAFMDDTPQEQMQKERMERIDSQHRTQSVDDAKKYFKLMCSGDVEGGKWCLRAKIDMQSVNGTMRDPVIFRQNILPHHRSGTAFKAYPTYDLACPIVDSIEGVTHALRTTEYNDRDEQYQWIQVALGLRRTRIHAFARMNFMYTELSKRKLGWFVDNGYVTGWDDARFPTIRGVMRRGVDIDALRAFICSNGASRRVVNMEWSKFWAENKKVIDLRSKRFMAIDKIENVKLTVCNAPDATDFSYVSTEYLPKNSSYGKRLVRISKDVLLEKADIEGVELHEEIVLMRWGKFHERISLLKIVNISDS